MPETVQFIPYLRGQNYPSSLVGERGKMKGKLLEAKLPVANGYILSSHVFHTLLTPQLKYQLNSALQLLDPQDPQSIKQATTQFRRFINRVEIPQELAQQIVEHYQLLGKNVVCRLTGSLAHQTAPNITMYSQGDNNILIDLRKCWAEIFEPVMLTRLVQQRLPFDSLYPVVLMEKFNQPKISGRLSTQNPHNGNKRTMLIEAVWGMSDYIQAHPGEADQYEIDKNSWDVVYTEHGTQEKEILLEKNKLKTSSVPASRKKAHKLADNQLLKLSQLSKKLHKTFFFPQEFTWEIDKNNEIILTGISELQESALSQKLSGVYARPLIYGVSVYKGQIIGKAKVFKHFTEKDKNSFSKTDILVIKHIHPSQLKYLSEAGGVVCDTSLLPRDVERLRIPCIGNAQVATAAIRDGQLITMFADYGVVFDGAVQTDSAPGHNQSNPKLATQQTRIWYQLERPSHFSPELIEQSHGIGPITGKSIIEVLNIHPTVLKQRNKLSILEEAIYEYLHILLQSSENKPVLYELIDMTSSEYRQLSGAEGQESAEENSIFGYHGAYRLLLEKEIVELQLRVLRKLDQSFPQQLSLSIPFVRTIEEWVLVKKIIDQHEIRMPLWVGISTPSIALNFHLCLQHGASGAIIHEKDLFSIFTASLQDQPHELLPRVELNDGYFYLLAFIANAAKKMKASVLYADHSGLTRVIERVRKNGITEISVTRPQFEQIVEK